MNRDFAKLVKRLKRPPKLKARTKPLFEVRDNPSKQFLSWDGDVLVANAHKAQKQAYDAEERFTLTLAGSRSGKALDVTTPIPTPKGFVPIGDLVVGDQVYDEKSNVCNVTGAFDVMYNRPCYRVTFDDGVSVVCDEEHLWVTQTTKQRKNMVRRVPNPNPSFSCRPQCQPTPDFSVRTTKEIAETLLDNRGATNHSIDLAPRVDYERKQLPIAPYTLGIWLGDGHSSSARITTPDEGVLEEIRKDGYSVGPPRECGGGKAKDYLLGGAGRIGGTAESRIHSLNSILRLNGLLNNKHIPDAYMTASAEQRLSLLQGLMDSDGYCGHNECEFCSIRELLSRQVLELCRSLGVKARIYSKIPTCNGKKCTRAWIVRFTTTVPVFRLARKLAKMKGETRPECKRRFIVSVEPVESVPVRCIAVDSPSHQYLCTRDYVPTHNTAIGPFWLLKEMIRKGPGEYLCAAPSFKILERGILKAIRRVFCSELKIGKNIGGSSGYIRITERGHQKLWPNIPYDPNQETKIIFGHAANPDSLEAAEYKAAWLDEAGQKIFKTEAWEAINRRLAIDEGRALLTTTPYMLSHWIKSEVHDAFKRRGTSEEKEFDKNYRVVSFESRANPLFPMEEWERAKATLPQYKFDLFYRGILTRPPGQIYDCFNPDLADGMNGGMVYDPKKYFGHLPNCYPPDHWPRYVGIDFGSPNFAATFYAGEMILDEVETAKQGKPVEMLSGRLVLYREYVPHESRTCREHVVELMKGETHLPDVCAGGSKSEGQWRLDFEAAGYPIREPDQTDVEVGILRTYAQIKSGMIGTLPGLIVSSDCKETLEQLANYVRPVDELGNILEGIEEKDTFHLCDSARYLISLLRSTVPQVDIFF